MGHRLRRLLPLLALAAGSVLVTLLAAEAAVRLLDLGPRFQVVYRELFQLSENPALRYELRPGAPTVNAAGFRGREVPREKAPGVFRIAAIGDSVTFGPPASAATPWPRQLEALLASAGGAVRFEVLNFGVTGYDVLQVAERLSTLGMSYDPDLIVYAYVLNDPQAWSLEEEALRRLREDRERRLLGGLRQGALRQLAASRLFLLARHGLGRLSEKDDRGRPLRPRLQDPAYAAIRGGDRRGDYFRALHTAPEGRRRLREGLDRIARAAGEAQVPVAMAIFPVFLASTASGEYALADVHALVAEEGRERGLDVIDLQPAFAEALAEAARRGAPASPWLVADFLHPGPAGRRVAAEALLRELDALGRLPAR